MDMSKSNIYKWIDKNVPRHSQHEYRNLLEDNEQLARSLFRRCMELDALALAYEALQIEVYDTYRMPPIGPAAAACYDGYSMQSTVQVKWSIPEYKMNYALDPCIRNRRDVGPAIMQAAHAGFNKQYVPALWEATARELFCMAEKIHE